MRTLTDDEFTGVVAAGNVPVEFGADWCGPCRMSAPTRYQDGRSVARTVGARPKIHLMAWLEPHL